MRKNYFNSIPIVLGGMLMFTSCTDNDYDLSDIDTTTAIKFDNLVVPVNMDNIYLDQVLKVEDDNPDNPIKIFTDKEGKKRYAINIDGEFFSDPMYIQLLEASGNAIVNAMPIILDGGMIRNVSTNYKYEISSGGVDNSIVKIYRMGLIKPLEINLNFYYSTSSDIPEISDLVLQIPETFTAFYKGSEFSNGEVHVNIYNGKLDEPIYIYAIDFGEGVEPTGEPGYKSLVFEGEIGIKSGKVLSASNDLMADFSMSSFTANEISGAINYELQTPELEPVSLENLPDFLREGESQLIINNPQLYLYFGNPTTADFYSQLSIVPWGNNGMILDIPINGFKDAFVVAADIQDLALINNYAGAVLKKEEDLKYILYGNGLPESMTFSLNNTYVRGDVLNLTLGQELSIGGNYSFFTPLSFGPGSQIIYQKSETDFFGEDVEAVNVTQFQLSAYPSTNLPFDVELTVYPLDREGNHIFTDGKEISASGIVEANADGSKILDINFNTPFTGLDGVEYRVSSVVQNNEALRPEQFIKLDKIRARVTGEYITKF